MTFRAQAAPALGRKAEGRGSRVKLKGDWGTEELATPSLLASGAWRFCTLTKAVSPG